MNKPDYLISTPENVDLHLELAGLGNRIMAGLVDRLLMGVGNLTIIGALVGGAVAFENTPLPTDSKTQVYYYLVGIGLLLLFILNFGYFIFFEGMWKGQTPGKRVAQIRVIEANGQPVGLMRIVDELPGVYLGILPMLIDKNERRFGDLAAGTLVIRERLQSLSTSSLRIVGGPQAEALVDTGQISPDDYSLLVSFLKRRDTLTLAQRKEIASEMATHLRHKLAVSEDEDSPELFIEKLYVAYNKRAELAAE
jgi:uncharacterized RDD family membrane protein YckC